MALSLAGQHAGRGAISMYSRGMSASPAPNSRWKILCIKGHLTYENKCWLAVIWGHEDTVINIRNVTPANFWWLFLFMRTFLVDQSIMIVWLFCVGAYSCIGLLIGPILWGHSGPLWRCCRCGHRFYIAIHQVSLLSHAACAIAIAGFGSSW